MKHGKSLLPFNNASSFSKNRKMSLLKPQAIPIIESPSWSSANKNQLFASSCKRNSDAQALYQNMTAITGFEETIKPAGAQKLESSSSVG